MKIFIGPCVIDERVEESASFVLGLSKLYPQHDFIFKASFDKANRTEISSFRGPGLVKGVEILTTLKIKHAVKVMTDIHEPNQAMAMTNIDFIQIPAMLSRQTDLLVEAGKTGKPVLIKMMTSATAASMIHTRAKVKYSEVYICYRGTTYGPDLLFDVRVIRDLKDLKLPVVADITHTNHGKKELTFDYARLCQPLVDGFFLEIYPEPDKAKSDGRFALNFEEAQTLVKSW